MLDHPCLAREHQSMDEYLTSLPPEAALGWGVYSRDSAYICKLAQHCYLLSNIYRQYI